MKDYSMEEVASRIDHAALKPQLSESDLKDHADLCRRFGVATMCVRPCDIRLAASLLESSPVAVSCVLSFPHGADTEPVKVCQARQAVEDGVREIDMVMNIGKFLSGRHDYVRDEIGAVVETAHAAGVTVKVIQESCYLTLDQVEEACRIALDAGADFVKTSTGFGPSSATPDIIAAMVRAVGGKIGIKASGGIRTWEQAVGYLEQGATRLGIGSTEAVLTGGTGAAGY
jgi:deoxyribose-phosphate aldolase